jgi:integrase
LRTRLLGEIDRGRVSGNKATVAELLTRWLDTANHEFTTRDGYERYIATKILPALGDVQVRKLTVETLDQFYAELRKRGGVGGRPLAGSTVRKVHFILRAALGLALKWGWIPDNPAELATVPRFVRQDVDPPTPEDVTRFLEAAWACDPDLGTLLWLAMTTGARRGELCGLRWPHVRLDDGYVLIARSFVHRGRERREKDTKTHQSRRVALDGVTAEILAEHHARCEARAAACEAAVRPDGYVFSSAVDGRDPVLPDSLTRRISGCPDTSVSTSPSAASGTTPPRRCSPVASTSAPPPAAWAMVTAAPRPSASTPTSSPPPTNAPPKSSRGS